MVSIRAFRGVRPTKELAEKVASPPYDVLDSEEARTLAAGNPFSFLHVVKPEIDLDPSISLYDDAVYAKGKENLQALIAQKILVQDPSPYLYIYSQQMGEHLQYGLVCAASVDDYEADRIKKHELTREDKEKDRTRHVDTLNANTGPVFLTYRAQDSITLKIEALTTQEPEYHFTSSDGVTHTFWVVKNAAQIAELEEEFAKLPHLYVADGHHRSASACRVRTLRRANNPHHTGDEPYNFFLAVLFPDNQMNILPYNRVITDFGELTEQQFISRLNELFSPLSAAKASPDREKSFSVYIGGAWKSYAIPQSLYDPDDAVDRLDVQILQKKVFSALLGIHNPRQDSRIKFIGGIRGTQELERLVDSGKYCMAFSLYPTTIEQLIAIADAGKIMPPKSTWFEPKLRSGLVIHALS